MPRRHNKMITLTVGELDFIDANLKGSFSNHVSKWLSDYITGAKLAQDMSSRQLLSMVLARQYNNKESYDAFKQTRAVELIVDLIEGCDLE